MNFYEYLIEEVKLDNTLLKEALTHPSYCSIVSDAIHYERLEFVGDSVLDLFIAEWLYTNVPKKVGILSKLRSTLVKTDVLAEIGEKIRLEEHLITDKKYEITKTDLEDSLEAIIGAVYLSKKWKKTQEFIEYLFKDRLNALKGVIKSDLELKEILKQAVDEKNPINKLQEFCQKRRLEMPRYSQIEKRGEEHLPEFEMEGKIEYKGKIIRARGIARRRKTAKKEAARKILIELEQINE